MSTILNLLAPCSCTHTLAKRGAVWQSSNHWICQSYFSFFWLTLCHLIWTLWRDCSLHRASQLSDSTESSWESTVVYAGLCKLRLLAIRHCFLVWNATLAKVAERLHFLDLLCQPQDPQVMSCLAQRPLLLRNRTFIAFDIKQTDAHLIVTGRFTKNMEKGRIDLKGVMQLGLGALTLRVDDCRGENSDKGQDTSN